MFLEPKLHLGLVIKVKLLLFVVESLRDIISVVLGVLGVFGDTLRVWVVSGYVFVFSLG